MLKLAQRKAVTAEVVDAEAVMPREASAQLRGWCWWPTLVREDAAACQGAESECQKQMLVLVLPMLARVAE